MHALPSGSLTSRTLAGTAASIDSAATPSAPAGCTASHWPPRDDAVGAPAAASSAQPTLYRATAELSRASAAAVAHVERAPTEADRRAAAHARRSNARRLCSSACAIVPLYPNDDTPPSQRPPDRPSHRAVGSAHAAPPADASPTRGLSRRSCAFGAASPRASAAASTSSPAIAAAGSAWPAVRLDAPTASGACAARPTCSSAAASEPASIGSPSAVPVPCASSRATPAARNASLAKRRLQQRALRRAVGRRQARAPPVLPHRAAAQHRYRRGRRRQVAAPPAPHASPRT